MSPETQVFRLAWLEIYLDIFQKYALLALLGFFLAAGPYFGPMFRKGSLTLLARTSLGLLAVLLGSVFSLLDLSRYGESAWAFFDLQIVLATAAGILGGPVAGIGSGILFALFRRHFLPAEMMYPALVLGAGILGSVFRGLAPKLWGQAPQSYDSLGRLSFGAGALAGLVHGLVVYVPQRWWMTPPSFYFTLFFLAVLEGGGVLALNGVISGILREEKRRTTEKELLKTRLLFLQAQMNPHFVFNALNTISAVCGRENASQAQGLVAKLSDFLRRMLKREEDKVSLREEMSYIDAYLELEKARFGERLKIEKQIELKESAWETKIPILVLQPLVENAVKHGIGKKAEGGTVKIIIQEFNANANRKLNGGAIHGETAPLRRHELPLLLIQITDDGVGLPPHLSAKQRWTDPSFGGNPLPLVRQRTDPPIFVRKGGEGRVRGKEAVPCMDPNEGAGIGIRNIHERLIRIYGKVGAIHGETVPLRRHELPLLQFESAPGHGTTVTVRIPLCERGSSTEGAWPLGARPH